MQHSGLGGSDIGYVKERIERKSYMSYNVSAAYLLESVDIRLLLHL
jgi:hypothetical protein